ncbi:hypothetical protein [Mycobacterium paraterrae]|uniref:DUF5666 domain-containing protein n=1 Tax=Mycobacterium paraterrae TaxID=577492 RepID=A0ABY3VHX1_9MYCO|nr:hypothetical protein [Mycobacterium paraterrae]UMB69024.1 hypothetical protein MKK62_22020 [Mycobacterium paraterrae]
MQLTFNPDRLSGLATLAVAGVTVLSLGACSSSDHEKSPAPSSSPAAAKGKDSVNGLIASVSGDTVQVTGQAGTATVDVSKASKITEWTKAQLSDVAAGNCVTALGEPAPAPGGGLTAHAVSLSQEGGDKKCSQPKTGPKSVVGTVASVAGNTITVSATDANGKPAETAVSVVDSTQYNKAVSVNSSNISQGKCIAAVGTKEGNGALQATVVTLRPAHDGRCPQPAPKKK